MAWQQGSWYLYLKELRGKEIYDDVVNMLHHACSYAAAKNWTASFKRKKFYIQENHGPGRPIFVSTHENNHAVCDISDWPIRLNM